MKLKGGYYIINNHIIILGAIHYYEVVQQTIEVDTTKKFILDIEIFIIG